MGSRPLRDGLRIISTSTEVEGFWGGFILQVILSKEGNWTGKEVAGGRGS